MWQLVGQDLGAFSLTGNSVAPDGRLAIRTQGPASWFWPAAILDGRRGGTITPFLDPPDTDMYSASWDREGRVVMMADPFRSELWRFRPDPGD